MDTILIIIGILLLLGSFAGSILPFLPGPPLAYISLILLQLTNRHPFPVTFLVAWAVVTAAVVVLEYMIPIWGTKKFGGTKGGTRGATVGLIVGLFIPPWGFVIGPFVGAFIGELMNRQDSQKAFRSAIGSFIGFLAGTVVKIVLCLVMAFYFVKEVIV
ncbi:DUF456 domain-containing protein [Paludibacter sp.]|uniref:DUF456 domain-containing protein n=1 Tax=Paludibacter sp. TaxID=1898105 RepID=UPI00135589DE|nr:DUF456 domain-containing protein [Paludibacter sp.]MTK52202.1 DUF456 domain-containing protein [Paludibacter sp.]